MGFFGMTNILQLTLNSVCHSTHLTAKVTFHQLSHETRIPQKENFIVIKADSFMCGDCNEKLHVRYNTETRQESIATLTSL